ncbi:MAG: Mur ligase family protein [Firmicutes bacterium]|nr:Mur ligase family protein [Bacillota bacterium]
MDYQTAIKKLNELDALGSRLQGLGESCQLTVVSCQLKEDGFETENDATITQGGGELCVTPVAARVSKITQSSPPPCVAPPEPRAPNQVLAPMCELMRRLGDPQDGLRAVHVAGTNGKGSVVAYLDSIARAAKAKSGAYTSPCLEDFKENIRINGVQIGERDVAEHLTRVLEAADAMAADGFSRPTRFETETALAFLFFAAQSCQIVFIEAGMGGRDDATNIVKSPVLTVLTSVALDHTQILGDTLGRIAQVKCGIIKPSVPCVTEHPIKQAEAVTQTIRKACAEKNSRLIVCNRQKWPGLSKPWRFSYTTSGGLKLKVALSSKADYQSDNAVLAIEAACALGFNKKDIVSGLKNMEWFGRFSIVHKKPPFIVDGAHNPEGVESAVGNLLLLYPKKRYVLIVGMYQDKDASRVMRYLSGVAPIKKIITLDMPENRRLFRAEELKAIAARHLKNVCASTSPCDAVKKAIEAMGKDDLILALGSLSIIRPIERAAREIIDE